MYTPTTINVLSKWKVTRCQNAEELQASKQNNKNKEIKWNKQKKNSIYSLSWFSGWYLFLVPLRTKIQMIMISHFTQSFIQIEFNIKKKHANNNGKLMSFMYVNNMIIFTYWIILNISLFFYFHLFYLLRLVCCLSTFLLLFFFFFGFVYLLSNAYCLQNQTIDSFRWMNVLFCNKKKLLFMLNVYSADLVSGTKNIGWSKNIEKPNFTYI